MKKSPKRRGPEAGGAPSANLTIRLPVSLLNRLKERAEKEGIRVSDIAKQSFLFYLHLNPFKV
jgi:hypothetical protein